MKRRKFYVKNKPNKNLSRYAFISVFFAIFFSYLGFFKEPLSIQSKTSKQRSPKVAYPVQYSDTHITENAKISDPRFKDMVFVSQKDLLANVVSTISVNSSVLQNEGKESGTWLWTPTLQITPQYASQIISGAEKNGIKNIYLSIDSFLDIYAMEEGPEKDKLRQEFDSVVENFVDLASKSGISVDLEGGWRNWAEIGNSYKAFAVLDYAIDFNKTHAAKVRGFQYDIEPYLLENFEKDKLKVLGNYVNLVDEAVARLDGTDLELTVVIPDFYDGESDVTPTFFYRGKQTYTFDHLLAVLDRRAGSKIILMSYRNFSVGEDGTVDISRNEVSLADKSQTKVIIAQETGQIEPQYMTYFGTNLLYYKKQVGIIEKAFASDKSFDGIATHYVNALLVLK